MIAAGWWGKAKTVSQMVMVILMIADIERLALATEILMWIALALTLISMIDYFMKNKEVMKGSM